MLAIFFIIGLIVGSFLGAVNYRLKEAEDIVWKRSHCRHCKEIIRWYDNIPLLSFVILTGRCRKCKKSISWEYPLIELLTGLLFAAVAAKFLGLAGSLGFTANPNHILTNVDMVSMAFWLFAVCYLVLIFFHDLDYMLVSDAVVYPAIVITLVYQYWRYLESPLGIADPRNPFLGALIGALAAALFFFALIWISRGKWIGGGDVKIGFLAGALVGWPGILFVLFFAYMVGALWSLGLIATGLKNWKSQIPFGPFLVTAVLFVMFFSEHILFWANRYLNIGY